MYGLKKNGKVFTSKLVGTGHSSHEKRIYRAAVSQRLRSTGLDTVQCRLRGARTAVTKQTLEFVCSIVNLGFFVREEIQIISSQQKNNAYGFCISSGRKHTVPTLILCVLVLEQYALAQ